MRIAIAGLLHESNTFARTPTTLASFSSGALVFGQPFADQWSAAHHEVAGFFTAAQRREVATLPVGLAIATPSGPVTRDCFDQLCERLIGPIANAARRGEIEGLALALHGAMVVDGSPDGDGAFLARLRAEIGPALPVVVTLDFHANVSPTMVAAATAIVSYQTNPHIDQRVRGQRAAGILIDTLAGRVRPVMAYAQPACLIGIAAQNTSLLPLAAHMERARAFEGQPGVLAVSLLAGFPYADVSEMGPSVIAVCDGDRALATSIVAETVRQIEADRDALLRPLSPLPDAVASAIASAERPVVLVDFGDNVGGGAPGDSTFVLRELLRQDAKGFWVILADAESAAAAIRAGVGAEISLEVGGKTDAMHGTPVAITGRVAATSDGRWHEPAVRHGGWRDHDMGPTALVSLPGDNLLALSTRPHPPFSLGQITHLGIDPSARRILVVKAAIAYRAAYEPVAKRIIEIDTAGLTANDPRHFQYARARRPLYPLPD